MAYNVPCLVREDLGLRKHWQRHVGLIKVLVTSDDEE